MTIRSKNLSPAEGLRLARITSRWQKTQKQASNQARANIARFKRLAIRSLNQRINGLNAPFNLIHNPNDPSGSSSASVQLSDEFKAKPSAQRTLHLSDQLPPYDRAHFAIQAKDVLTHYQQTLSIPRHILKGHISPQDLKAIIYELLQSHQFINLKFKDEICSAHHLLNLLLTALRNHHAPQHIQDVETHLMKTYLQNPSPDTNGLIIAGVILKTMRLYYPRDHFVQITQAYLSDIICSQAVSPSQVKLFLFINHSQLIEEGSYEGFLDQDWFREQMRSCGLNEESIQGLVNLSYQKHFYKKIDNIKELKQFLHLCQNQPDGFLDYVSFYLPQIKTSRSSAEDFVTWIKKFIRSSNQDNNPIYNTPSYLRGFSIASESRRLENEQEATLLAEVYAASEAADYDADFERKVIHGKLFPVLSASVSWFTERGHQRRQNFLSQLFLSNQFETPYKMKSVQGFSPRFLGRWHKDFETDYHVTAHSSVDRFLFNARTRFLRHLHTIHSHLITLNVNPNFRFQYHWENITLVNSMLNNCDGSQGSLQQLRDTIQDCHDSLKNDIAYIVRDHPSAHVRDFQDYLKKCLAFLDQTIQQHDSPTDQSATYKIKITSDHELMLRTGEEPYLNCLSLKERHGVNRHGISLQRTAFVNYKTFVLHKETKDDDEIQAFADMEIRQYQSGPVLIVDKFYLGDGVIDELYFKAVIYDYAQTQLGLSKDQVYFPDREDELPPIESLMLKEHTNLELSPDLKRDYIQRLSELDVYRDHFHI